jgi:hypothetical protein
LQDALLGITRDDQHTHVGAYFLQSMSDTEPVHSRQPDIGDKQVDRFALASCELPQEGMAGEGVPFRSL